MASAREEERWRRTPRPADASRSGRSWLEPTGGALFAIWVVGQLARDATLVTAWFFYLPSVVVAAVLASLAIAARVRGRPALRLALASLVPLAHGLVVEHRWTRPPVVAGETALRLVHWNVAGGWVEGGRQADQIAALAPDLVVLSEGPERVARVVTEALPGFRSRSFGSLSVISRDPGAGAWLERRRELQAIEVPVGWHGRVLRILAVNLASSPRVHRDPWLRRVVQLTAERRPDLVVGDFNSPRRSRALETLPPGFRHAYLEAGRGWSASFPEPLPLWSLDHVLVGDGWRAADYRLVSTPWSDHRLQSVALAPASGVTVRSSSPAASPGTP